MKLYIIHGYGASPQDHWFPWLQQQAAQQGAEVNVLKMPTPLEPKLDEWLFTLRQNISPPNQNTFFIAHSLGCITLLRYLDSLQEDTKIGGIILVSGFSSPLPHLSQLDSFTKDQIDYEHIKKMTPHRVLMEAMDDQWVPYVYTEELGKLLNAKIVKLAKGGHFLAEDGFTQFPVLLDEFLKLTP